MNLVLAGLYVGLGFLVASALFRKYPPDSRPSADLGDVLLFLVVLSGWPVVATGALLYIPAQAFIKYLSYLKRMANA